MKNIKLIVNKISRCILSFMLAALIFPGLTSARPFIVGADISWVLEDESIGATYWDNGVKKDLLQILKEHGFNFIRIRTFVDPCAPEGYAKNSYSGANPNVCWCDLDHTIAIARRIKEHQMGFLLDFHMSDTWASIGHQYVPRAWANDNDEQMRKKAYEYVKHNIQTLVDLGLRPDMVQVGNEINSKMSGVSISNADRFAALVNAGVKGVRDVDPTIKIVLQHGRPRPDGDFMNWYNTIKNRIDFDFIGGSTYGTTNNGGDWREMFGNVAGDGIAVMSLEHTAQRTKLIYDVMYNLPNQMGLGCFAWEPTRYSDYPMFDRSGNKYTSNSRLDDVLALAKQYNATLPDWVQIGSGTRYEIKTTAAPGGIIEQSPSGSSLAEGAKVEFKAVPLDGWVFAGWSGDHTGTNPTYTVSSLKSNITLNAVFTFTSTDSIHYEGENTKMINSIVESTNSGFSGTGYANFNNEVGSSIEFAVCVSGNGERKAVITFANGSSVDRPVSVTVNGSVVINSLSFNPTGAWTTWNTKEISINLVKGVNTITLTSLSSDGGPNIDKIVLESAVSTAAGSSLFIPGLVYNPANFTIQANCPGKAIHINMYAVNGKSVLNRKLSSASNQQFRIPIEQFDNGLYILKLSGGNSSQVHRVNIVK